MKHIIKFFLPSFETREELMGGEKYWMIYRTWLGLSLFYERWNTPETAQARLNELL